VRAGRLGRDSSLGAGSAKTGAPVKRFGTNGLVDMKQYAVYGTGQVIDLEAGEIGLHSTPAVTKSGVVLVGSSFREGNAPKTHNNTKGLVLAFDLRTGKKLWQFNTIPGQANLAMTPGCANHGRPTATPEYGRRLLSMSSSASFIFRSRRRLRPLWRPTARKRSFRRDAGMRRSENWPAQVALPVVASSDMGLRYFVRADADLNVNGHVVKAVIQPTKQVLALCVRPRGRTTDLAH
jgi:outer membrane protein assembly factor BamB